MPQKSDTHPPISLIIGLGLAGTITALEAVERGFRVTCVNDTHRTAASRAAAGILNPITGPRLNLSWNVHQCMPCAEAFYRHYEGRWGEKFFERRTIRRLFRTERELDFHEKRRKQHDTHDFLSARLENRKEEGILTPLGECHLNAGILDIDTFLQSAHRWLAAHPQVQFLEESLDYGELIPEGDSCTWREQTFSHVIFCEGYEVRHNPWFTYLRFKPAKGESLKVTLTQELPSDILSAKKWILPLGNKCARVGSTYSWDTLNDLPTPEGKQDLIEGIATMLKNNPITDTCEHRAGVRPCSHDTKPYLGSHPEFTSLVILNGLGSKGTLLSPWCAKHLLDHLQHGTPLHPQLDVKRHKLS